MTWRARWRRIKRFYVLITTPVEDHPPYTAKLKGRGE